MLILQQATNILEENNFFKGKNLYAYQKNKNSLQALPPLIEQMWAVCTKVYCIPSITAVFQSAFIS